MTNKKRLTISILCLLMLIVSMFAFSACGGGKVENFNLSFKVDGESYSTISTNGAEVVAIPENPSKEGYTFDGWYWDKDVWSKPFTANSLMDAPISSDMSVYAKFSAIEYDITYENDGGTHNNPVSYTVEDGFALSAAEKLGYSFVGWYSDNAYTTKVESVSVGSTGAISLYAKFEIENYTISYENTKDVQNTNATGYNVNTDTIILSDLSKTGYTFEGWYNGEQKVTEIAKGSTGDLTLTARWSIDGYSITYHNTEGSTNTNPNGYDVEDLPLTLSNASKDYYNFLGWYTEATFENKVTEIAVGTTGNINLYAKWEAVEYTATFKDGNTVVDEIKFTVETDSITEPVVPTHAGYTGVWESYTLGVENIVINAIYSKVDYTISYHNVTGATNTNPAGYNVETLPIELNDARKAGYTFLGWYTEPTFENKVSEITDGTTGNINLYAKWEIIEYTATFKDGNTVVDKITFTVETDSITEPAVPTHTGYTGVWESYTLGTDSITVNAIYTTIEYTATFKDGNTVVGTVKFTVETDSITAPAVPNHVGYTGVWENYTLGAENITVDAVYDAIEYTATFKDGDTIVDEIIFTVESGSVNEPVVPSHAGYTGRWEEYTLGTQDITINAIYEIVPYGIIYHNTTGATHSNPTDYDVEDQPIFLKDANKIGYKFVGWYTEDTFENKVTEIEIGTTETVNLYAKWEIIEYTATFKDGDTVVDEITFTVETNSIDVPTVPVHVGYTGRWENYTLGTTDITVNAIYEIIPYSITYHNVAGATNTNPNGYDVEDEPIVLSDASKDYYNFLGWYTEATFENKVTEIAVGTTGNINLYAKWEAIEYIATFKDGNTVVDEIKFTVETDSITAPAVPTHTGYTGVWESYTLGTENITINAVYTAIKYTAVFKANGVIVDEIEFTIESELIEEPAVPEKRGYTGKWQDYSISAGHLTIEATYEIIEYQIVFENTKGANNPNPIKYTIESDTIVLENITYEGFSFKGWFIEDEQVYSIEKGTTGDLLLYASWVEYALGDITYDATKTAIKTTDVISAELFGAKCIDTDGNTIQITAVASTSVLEAGTEISVQFTAKNGSYAKRMTLSGIKVYGEPTITIDRNKTTVNLTDDITPELFNVQGVDSFGEATDIQFEIYVYTYDGITNSGILVSGNYIGAGYLPVVEYGVDYKGGDILHIHFTAIDAAGNSVEITTSDVRVYGAPTINYEDVGGVRLDDVLNDTIDLSKYNATAKDSFGESLDVECSYELPTPHIFNYWKNSDGLWEKSMYARTGYNSTEVEFIALNNQTHYVYYRTDTVKVQNYIKVTCNETGQKIFDSSILYNTTLYNYYNSTEKELICSFVAVAGYTYTIKLTPKNGGTAYAYVQTSDLIDKTIYEGHQITAKFKAVDDFGNENVLTVNSYIYGNPKYYGRNGNYAIKDVDGVDGLDIYFYDSLDNRIENITTRLSSGELKTGETVYIDVLAIDVAGNEYSITVAADVYGEPIWKNIPNRLYYTDQSTDTALITKSNIGDILAVDSYGNELDIHVMESPVGESGTVQHWVLKATDNAGWELIKEFDVYIYDVDDIVFTYGNLNNTNVSLTGQGKEFNATATDSFGEACEIYLENENGYRIAGGYNGSVVLVAVDLAGNEVRSSITYKDVKVYDTPVVEFLVDYLYENTVADFVAVVKDSFGEELFADISYESELVVGEMATVLISAVDIAGNEFYGSYELPVVASDLEVEKTEDGFTLIKYNGTATSLTIPSYINRIASRAFAGNATLEEVVVGNHVLEIGAEAFAEVTALKSLTVPFVGGRAEPTESWENSYAWIFSLTEYEGSQAFSASCDSYGSTRTFYKPTILEKIIVNSNVSDFGFCYASGFAIELGEGCETIGKYAFAGSTIGAMILPDGLKTIGNYAFYDCEELLSIEIPSSVVRVGENAFSNCTALADVKLSEGLKYIGQYAFYYTPLLVEIDIPSSIVSIGKNAFHVQSEALKVNITDLNKWVNISFTNAYANPAATSGDLYLNGAPVSEISLDDEITYISTYAFYNVKINRVNIPKMLTRIGTDAFYASAVAEVFVEDIEQWLAIDFASMTSNPVLENTAFYVNGALLENLSIPDTVSEIKQYSLAYIDIDTLVIGAHVKRLGSYNFYYTSGTTLTIENPNLTIDTNAFTYAAFTDITAPMTVVNRLKSANKVTRLIITNCAMDITATTFSSFTALLELRLPANVTSIAESALSKQTKLTKLQIPYIGNTVNDANKFGYLFGTSSFTGSVSVKQTLAGESTASTFYMPASLTYVKVLGGSVTAGAFVGCTQLTDVDFGEDVISVVKTAFDTDAVFIETVDGVLYVDTWLIYGLGSSVPVTLTVREGTYAIAPGAFSQSTKINTVYMPNTIKHICQRAFYDSSIQQVIFPNDMTGTLDIGESCFYSTSLSKYGREPDTGVNLFNVTTIGANAFTSTKTIKTLVVGQYVTVIGANAFAECNYITTATFEDTETWYVNGAVMDVTGNMSYELYHWAQGSARYEWTKE